MAERHEEQLSTADVAGTSRRDDVDVRDASADTRDRVRSNADMEVNNSGTIIEQSRTPLFPSNQAQDFRTRWDGIQAGFVDEPRRAVEQADSLIAEVMKSLAASFAEERSNLESQWDSGDDVSTEDLRIGLQRYRSFFDRLLSV